MNYSEEDRLWREILTGEDLDPLRRTALQAGLAAMAKRRRTRQRWMIAGMAAPLAAILAFSFHGRAPVAAPPIGGARTALPVAPVVKLINDAELLALFPNRAVALIGPPGQQQLRFLDGNPSPGD
jgi:hypothetical protein